MRSDPRFNLIEPMIALRQYVGQPNHGGLAQTQAGTIAVGGVMLIQQFGYPHFGQHRDEYRNVVNRFVEYIDRSRHSTSLIQFSNPRKIRANDQ
ncbi:MAG: hypothetical protein HOP19_14165 [Acidobacteria bacterium]|nr:hypothetical protein [Acidobacteriota bacterium]